MSRSDEEIPYNFGALSMPEGYRVSWWSCHEHYQAVGPDDWEGSISIDPHWCRRQAIEHAKQQEPTATKGEPS